MPLTRPSGYAAARRVACSASCSTCILVATRACCRSLRIGDVAERERAEDERRERAGIAGAKKALATARELAATARRVLRVLIAMIVFACSGASGFTVLYMLAKIPSSRYFCFLK